MKKLSSTRKKFLIRILSLDYALRALDSNVEEWDEEGFKDEYWMTIDEWQEALDILCQYLSRKL